jgi:serine/threonine protein kinase
LENNSVDLKFEFVIQEINVWQKFDHSNIVKYYNHFKNEDFFMMEIEYIDGDNLKQLIDIENKINRFQKAL